MADFTAPATTTPKPVHTIVLDAGPILKNTPPLSTLLAQSEELLITPSVVSEIRDPAARQRVETLYLPFLKQRTPSPKSVAVISEFARKTGDRAVLSRTDLEVIALAYEIECERNGGDWRLRSVPGQKQVNGKPPAPVVAQENKPEQETDKPAGEKVEEAPENKDTEVKAERTDVDAVAEELKDAKLEDQHDAEKQPEPEVVFSENAELPAEDEEEGSDENDDDDDGWITPSNLKKRQARDEASSVSAAPEPKVMQVATMTTDFACQNVLLQMNLNLLSTTTLQRIRHLKSFVKRCHACFSTTKDMNKQFCPRCGKDTLTRVSCTTNSNGQFTMHLKKNMQWNNRGNVYSVPKPVHGSSNGKWKGGGGKGGWGTELIFAEDQKEFSRATAEQNRRMRKEHDLMDEDYLPSILSGERNKHGRVRVGAGRNVNSRKR
ncbi:D-site 20S pre-rRNA nuclease [Aspergillus japonicus CBS 114.51]|uniref:20S-pre-rRNA D-site endonuclease NOB1 n=2 Tax=Aspergillus TaxID=5052 RepID=A0A2V5IG80_ASPV1|nr:D-site 20S pre-rRNA nuclease [Aspergillus japonicus CBS 114.51]PYI22947.1 D-site 20S pre-rRNA nuclease [Aspergillus violaceofuscus CBS 115571]RAH85101.1 D-site 20S pre-rRNA nuclease [Aspergillus japonicus CBS 114.51]